MSKKDLIECMPESPEARKAVQKAVSEIVDSMVRLQGEKELIGAVKEVCEEKYSVSGKYVEAQARFYYDKLYNESKAAQKAKATYEILEEFEQYFD